jgi:polar amino acid transport system permease protein
MIQYSFDFSVLWVAWRQLLFGCLLTLEISLAGMAVAFVIGIALANAKGSRVRPVRVAATAFIEIVRNTPFLVQLFFMFFGLPQLGITLKPNVAAIVTLGLNGGAYAAEIIRAGLGSVHKAQREAGLALGLNPLQVFRYIVFVPALRAVYPALCSQFILLLLTSSIVSSISARELTSVGYLIESQTFRSFEVYFTLTAIYLLMAVGVSFLLKAIGRIAFAYPVR